MNKKTTAISTLTLLLPVLCGILLWNRLPAEIPTHFNFRGEPDGYSSKAFTVFVLPLFLLLIHLVCIFTVNRDKSAEKQPNKIKILIPWICPIISNTVFACIYSYALGRGLNISTTFSLVLGLEFVIIGNYMPKCRQNNVIGVRVPWTLADEEVWNKTHRLAGWTMVICGFAVLFGGALSLWNVFVSFIIILTSSFIPVFYSAIIYHSKRSGQK